MLDLVKKIVDTVKALQPLHSDHLPSAILLFTKAKQRQKQSKSSGSKDGSWEVKKLQRVTDVGCVLIKSTLYSQAKDVRNTAYWTGIVE